MFFALGEVLVESLRNLFATFLETRREDDAEDNGHNDEDAEHASPMDGTAEDVADESGTDDKAQQLEGQELNSAGAAAVPKGNDVFTLTSVTHQGPKERCTDDDGEQGRYDVCPWRGQHVGDVGFAEIN